MINIDQPVVRKWLKTTAIILFWLAVWEIADRVVDNRIILSGPIHIMDALFKQVARSDFWEIVGASFFRIVAGFALSFLCGFILALIAYHFRLVKDFLEPLMLTLKTVPVISFVIMLLIWVGNQSLTIYLAFLIVLPLIYTNTLAGFGNVDRHMLEMAKTFRLSRWKSFLYIYRPVFMPFLISSCEVSLGLSWKSGIMAEVIGTPRPSIGREMFQAQSYLATSNLFAWTLIVIVLSILFEKSFLLLLKGMNRPLGSWIGKEK